MARSIADPVGWPRPFMRPAELFRSRDPEGRADRQSGLLPNECHLGAGATFERRPVEPSDIIVDSKSGVSGAGRTLKMTTLYPECNESISAYNVGRHRHTPEIEQVLSTASGPLCAVDLHAAPGADGPGHSDHGLFAPERRV